MTFPDWPQAQQVFSETDLGADGSFEQSTFVAADRILHVSRNGNEVVLKWRSSATSDVIESANSLTDPKWSVVNGTPEQDGEWRTLKLPATGAANFYRVRP